MNTLKLDFNEFSNDSGFSTDSLFEESVASPDFDREEYMKIGKHALGYRLSVNLFSSPSKDGSLTPTRHFSRFSLNSVTPKAIGAENIHSEVNNSPSLIRCRTELFVSRSPLKRHRSEVISNSSTYKRIKVHSNNDAHIHRHKSELFIKSAMEKSNDNCKLTGDFANELILPVEKTVCKNNDLNSISPSTMKNLLEGSYSDQINKYLIIDCRYPYEYEAGHIKNAVNLYTKDMILDTLLNQVYANTLLVFHCEFSSERGPNMCRFLRNMDREQNRENYPKLSYPEMYLLKDGYKAFFDNSVSLCTPPVYLPMLHPDFKQQLCKYRLKRRKEKRKYKQ